MGGLLVGWLVGVLSEWLLMVLRRAGRLVVLRECDDKSLICW